ncbi:hypothetical protein RI367_000985 [Sorochytrium milnesiophthora]
MLPSSFRQSTTRASFSYAVAAATVARRFSCILERSAPPRRAYRPSTLRSETPWHVHDWKQDFLVRLREKNYRDALALYCSVGDQRRQAGSDSPVSTQEMKHVVRGVVDSLIHLPHKQRRLPARSDTSDDRQVWTQLAQLLSDLHQRDPRSMTARDHNALLYALATDLGREREVMRQYRWMRERGIALSVFPLNNYNHIIALYTRRGDLDTVHRLLQLLRHELAVAPPEYKSIAQSNLAAAYTGHLTALSQSPALLSRHIEQLHRDLTTAPEGEHVLYSAQFAGLLLQTVAHMEPPNVVLFDRILSDLKKRKGTVAVHSVAAYNAQLYVLLHVLHDHAGFTRLLEEMRRHGVDRNVETHNLALQHYAATAPQRLLLQFNQIPHPTTESYDILFDGLRAQADAPSPATVAGYFCRMIVTGVRPSTRTFTAVMDIYLRLGQWPDALDTLRMLIESDVAALSEEVVDVLAAGLAAHRPDTPETASDELAETLFRCCAATGSARLATVLYNHLSACGSALSVSALVDVVTTLARGGDVDKAVEVIQCTSPDTTRSALVERLHQTSSRALAPVLDRLTKPEKQ